jgi:hypothetical protein
MGQAIVARRVDGVKSMRKALIGILIAATAATPLAAQDNGWHGRGDGEHHQRSEGEQRPARPARQQAPQQQQQAPQGQRQGGWQGRQQAQTQQQVQVQQQAQTRGYRQGGNWQSGGNVQQQQAYRQQIETSRAANRQVSQGMPERYQRRAAENEANYERQVTQQRYGREGQRSGYQGQTYQGQNYQNRSYQGRQGTQNRVQWNRTWRNDNRYDWQRYRYSNRDLFRSPYYAPRNYGYGYNRLSIGGLLDQIFWGRNYWIADPYEYRLPAAPYGTQWVRYYDDVVLVDVYSGEVLDVIYDFFW